MPARVGGAPIDDLGWPKLALHKFHFRVLRRTPDALKQAEDISPRRRWMQIDLALVGGVLMGKEHQSGPHLHREAEGGKVVHLHNEMDRRRGKTVIDLELSRVRSSLPGAR